MFRRDWPYFYAFDLLSVDDEDLTPKPLIERKRRLRAIMPRVQSRLLYVDHLERRGCGLFHAACERDLEGVVGKWAKGRYHNDGVQTSWIKMKNRTYSHMTHRREFFERRRDLRQHRRRDYWAVTLQEPPPLLSPHPLLQLALAKLSPLPWPPESSQSTIVAFPPVP